MADRMKMPIGVSDFEEIRSEDCYYIDKTSAIAQLVSDGARSILFTRPRRFGKTTFQTMLRSFFDIRKDSHDIFAGLDIMQYDEVVRTWMNKYPVIYLSFKDVDGRTYEEALDVLRGNIAELFQEYSFIDASESEGDAELFRNMQNGKGSQSEIRRSVNVLSKLLFRHYGQKVILLFDEYDIPLDKAKINGYYDEMLDVIRAIFLSVLKDCPYTAKGILTGCLRISKESFFSGLNNLAVYSVTDSAYASAFGFTEEEVSGLLSDAGLSDKADTVRKWYDGYSIGGMHIYTPWDVMLYTSKLMMCKDAEPENFWANSSGNDTIRRFIDMTDASISDDYSMLINGNEISKKISGTLTYGNLYSSEDNIWSLLLAAGYVTLAGKYYPNGESLLRLPNEEMKSLFASSVDEWFSAEVQQSNRKELFNAIWEGDAECLSGIISQYLFNTISYYDYREDYYHAFLAGLFSGAGYIVKSNRETGTGRADILLLDRRNRRAAVFEVKRTYDESHMEASADEALKQIKEKEYGEDLFGYQKIFLYGASFFKKEVFVKGGI